MGRLIAGRANYKLDRRKETGKGLVKTEVDKIGHLKAGTRKRDKDCSSMIVDLIFLKSKAKKNSLQG